MSEIRSYRRVFDLERRVYSIDRLRLNPGGVPLRGVVYFLALVLVAVASAAIPGPRLLARAVPWIARDLVLPAIAAAALSLVRIEGRVFHLAAAAIVREAVSSRRGRGPLSRSIEGRVWRPEPLVLLPDGSEGRLRGLRFDGPGAVRVSVAHECAPSRVGLRRALGRCTVEVRAPAGEDAAGARVIEISAGARLLVRSARPGEGRR